MVRNQSGMGTILRMFLAGVEVGPLEGPREQLPANLILQWGKNCVKPPVLGLLFQV